MKPPLRFRIFFFLITPAIFWTWLVGRLLGVGMMAQKLSEEESELLRQKIVDTNDEST
jgi:hypothetical protein